MADFAYWTAARGQPHIIGFKISQSVTVRIPEPSSRHLPRDITRAAASLKNGDRSRNSSSSQLFCIRLGQLRAGALDKANENRILTASAQGY